MHKDSWDGLLRRIPVAYHNGLILSTVTGKELVIQSFVALEDEYLIIRGRAAGTSDGVKVAIIPYQQINYVLINKAIVENKVTEMFGDSSFDYSAVSDSKSEFEETQANADSSSQADKKDSAGRVQPARPSGSGGNTPSNAAKPSKNDLLAKLRERLVDKPKSG